MAHLRANIPPVESLCWGVRGKLAVPSEIAAEQSEEGLLKHY